MRTSLINYPALLKLTVFVVVSVLSGVLVVNTITDPVNDSTVTYRAVFTDAEGLHPGSDVMVAGVRVGKIDTVAARDGSALVSFEVSRDQPVPSSGLAVIRYADLLGARYLAIMPGQGGPPLAPGSTIPLRRTRPALDLTALLNGFKPLFEAIDPKQVNQLASEIVAIFQGEGGTITDLLAKVVVLTSTLSSRDQVIGQTITNLNGALETMTQHRDDLQALVSSLGQLTSATANSRPRIAEALDSGSALAGSLSNVLGNVGPELSYDVRSLRGVADNLARNQAAINGTVQQLPGLVTTINRATDYGSWANVYLCNMSVSVGGTPIDLGAGPHSEVCR